MPRKRTTHPERECELDWHKPLYDQEDFQRYAKEVVLPAVRTKLASRRRIKLRLGKRKIIDVWIDHALNYLVLHNLIHAETRGQAITYFTSIVPAKKVLALPNLNENWSFGRTPRQVTPHWQEMARQETA